MRVNGVGGVWTTPLKIRSSSLLPLITHFFFSENFLVETTLAPNGLTKGFQGDLMKAWREIRYHARTAAPS